MYEMIRDVKVKSKMSNVLAKSFRFEFMPFGDFVFDLVIQRSSMNSLFSRVPVALFGRIHTFKSFSILQFLLSWKY